MRQDARYLLGMSRLQNKRIDGEAQAAWDWAYEQPCPECGHAIGRKQENFCEEGSMGWECERDCCCALSETAALQIIAYRLSKKG